MHKALINKISTIENIWLSDLSSEVERIFSQTWLPSHDLLHHLRVWKFAKDLLSAYSNSGYEFSADFIEALVLAVFFHDTGLSVTSDERHGLEGKLFAEKYMKDKVSLTENLQNELFQAIILHDDKNYANGQTIESKPGIYRILTLADDLDALGCLGLLRYLEIYWKRGISKKLILSEIERNLISRFKFLSQQLNFDPTLLYGQQFRFEQGMQVLLNLKESHLNYFYESFSKKFSVELLLGYNGTDVFLKIFLAEISNELKCFS